MSINNFPKILDKYKIYAPRIIRIGLAIVFLWFSINQIIAPNDWISYLPSWTNNLGITQTTFVLMNAIFELIFGTLLLLGVGTRIVALLLGLHLLGITMSVGYNEIGVRDFGLTIATIGIGIYGSDE